MCYHSPLVRDKLLAAPASVKLIYWRSGPVFNTNGHLVDPGDQKLDWNSQIWPWQEKNIIDSIRREIFWTFLGD